MEVITHKFTNEEVGLCRLMRAVNEAEALMIRLNTINLRIRYRHNGYIKEISYSNRQDNRQDS